jgi:Icc-related predicted phosphoesterase
MIMRNNNFNFIPAITIPSENSWESLFLQVKGVMVGLKEKISNDHFHHIALSISDRSSRQLLEGMNLSMLKDWLEEQHLVLTSLNGSHYLNLKSCLHNEDYHKPDWNTQERVEYTKRLNRILAVLLPFDQEGSITISPISLASWYKEHPGKIKAVNKTCALHLASIVEDLLHIRREVGKMIYLNLQILPLSILESEKHLIDFYDKYLLPVGVEHLFKKFKLSPSVAEDTIRSHMRICLNTSQIISAKRDAGEVASSFKNAGIRIGKIKLESVLKVKLSGGESDARLLNLISNLEEKNCYYSLYNSQTKNSSYYNFLKDVKSCLLNVPQELYILYSPPLSDKSYMKVDTCQGELKQMIQIFMQQKITSQIEFGIYNEKICNEIPEYTSFLRKDYKWMKEISKAKLVTK